MITSACGSFRDFVFHRCQNRCESSAKDAPPSLLSQDGAFFIMRHFSPLMAYQPVAAVSRLVASHCLIRGLISIALPMSPQVPDVAEAGLVQAAGRTDWRPAVAHRSAAAQSNGRSRRARGKQVGITRRSCKCIPLLKTLHSSFMGQEG